MAGRGAFFWRTPGFAAVVVLTLGLAIVRVNSTIFSVVYGVLPAACVPKVCPRQHSVVPGPLDEAAAGGLIGRAS